MKRNLYSLAALLTCCFMAFSCSSSSEEETLLSERCYISGFTLGQIKRTMHTTDSAGNDSTYTVTLSGSLYKMLIDQRNQTITNSDSLPMGSQLGAVLATITGTGSVVYAPVADTTSWTSFNTSDSIDFRQPLLFRIYSSTGRTQRDYTVRLNVRTTSPSEYTWTRLADLRVGSDVSDESRLLFVNGLPVVLSSEGSTDKIFVSKTTTADQPQWTEQECTGLGTAPVVTSAQYFGGRFWISCYHQLYSSADAVTWQPVGTDDVTPLCLFAASDKALYMSCEGADGTPGVACSADGQRWTTMEVEAGGFTGLPAAALAYEQENGNDRVLLLDDVSNGQEPYSAWSLLEEYENTWMQFAKAGDNDHLLPVRRRLCMACYVDMIFAMGGALVGDDASTALNKIYISWDNGISWWPSDTLSTPTAIQGTAGALAAASHGEYVWLVSGNQVWRFRLNSYGE